MSILRTDIRNKTFSPQDFEFTRFYCIYNTDHRVCAIPTCIYKRRRGNIMPKLKLQQHQPKSEFPDKCYYSTIYYRPVKSVHLSLIMITIHVILSIDSIFFYPLIAMSPF